MSGIHTPTETETMDATIITTTIISSHSSNKNAGSDNNFLTECPAKMISIFGDLGKNEFNHNRLICARSSTPDVYLSIPKLTAKK